MRVELCKSLTFEAAHSIPTFPEGHKCRRLHGHSFSVEIRVAGEVDERRGYLIDYGDIKAACEPIRQQLDHYHLNEIDGLSNPTSENIARWIWGRLKPVLPLLESITVRETCESACTYRGQ